MIWTSQPRERTATDAGMPEHLLLAASSVLAYLQARLELAGIESKDALAIYGALAGFLALGAGFLLFGYIFIWIGAIALVATLSGVSWGLVTLAAGILHLIGAAGFLWAAKAKWGRPVFSATLKEFRKDQQWLRSPQATANRN
jgi:uncharacterized membrane protein YqjE